MKDGWKTIRETTGELLWSRSYSSFSIVEYWRHSFIFKSEIINPWWVLTTEEIVIWDRWFFIKSDFSWLVVGSLNFQQGSNLGETVNEQDNRFVRVGKIVYLLVSYPTSDTAGSISWSHIICFAITYWLFRYFRQPNVKKRKREHQWMNRSER